MGHPAAVSDTPPDATEPKPDAPDPNAQDLPVEGSTESRPSPRDALAFIKRLGPRGIDGLFGWTFFDPANLVCVSLMVISAYLSVTSMRARGAPDWFMPIGLYVCLAALMRGYFFNYYNGKLLSRVLVWLVLILGLLATAFLWEDRSLPHDTLRRTGRIALTASPRFHTAALLHVIAAVTLTIHYLLPRRFLIKYTDELADLAGRDHADDAPPESVDDAAA